MRQLMLPFVVWAAIACIRYGDAGRFLMILRQPDLGLWFLEALFFISFTYMLAYEVAERLYIHKVYTVIVMYVAWFALSKVLGGQYGTSLVVSYLIPYGAGCLLYSYRMPIYETDNSIRVKRMLLCLMVFAIVGFFVRKDCSELDALHLPRSLWLLLIKVTHSVAWISGSLFFFYLVQIFDQTLVKHHIHKVGAASLGIYAIHFLIIHAYDQYITLEDAPINIAYMTTTLLSIGILILSYYGVLLIRKSRVLSLLLLGEK